MQNYIQQNRKCMWYEYDTNKDCP